MRNFKLYLLGIAVLTLLSVQIVFATQNVGTSISGSARVTPTPQGAEVVPFGPSKQTFPDGSVHQAPAFMGDDATPTIKETVGVPAIHPTILTAAPNAPGFTEADVRQYHASHHANRVAGYASSVAPTILKIEFLTQAELQKRTGQDAGVSGNTLLCYVQYSGLFTFDRRTATGTIAQTSDRAAEVFNAHTGNALMEGLGSWIK